MARESMDFDVIIVGAGPAGLSAACRLLQLAKEVNKQLSVCVVEKGAEVGAHILSGAVFETKALDELFPNWKTLDAPIRTRVIEDQIYLFASESRSFKIPNTFAPKTMHNQDNYVVSMGNVCRWLSEQATSLGGDIFPGFTADDILYNQDGSVAGVITGDMGVDKNNQPKNSYTQGMELKAKYTIFAEGCRGHLGKQLITKFNLDKGKAPQHYGLGFKEVWQVPKQDHQPGLVIHSAGWPLTSESSGGGFLYHGDNQQVYVGMIIDLNYQNPYFSPYETFQQFKHQKNISKYLKKGKRLSYGARAIAKGGFHSLAKMTFPGGLLIGCEVGLINFAKIKGNHTAMKSGMLAAESVFNAIFRHEQHTELITFTECFKKSWLFDELYRSRNFGGAITKLGAILGGCYNSIDQNIFAGKLPFTFVDTVADHLQLKPCAQSHKIVYPKPDNLLSFDRLSSLYLSNTYHEEDQPNHLILEDKSVPININLALYSEPAQRYCPAGVYEVVFTEEKGQHLVINAANCLHCKTCDIKDPSANITWQPPEGGGGPNYSNM